MKFDQKLALLGDRRGWNQVTLRDKLGCVSRSTVHRWFSGERLPRIDEGLRLAQVLSVPLDVLADDAADLTSLDMTATEIDAWIRQTIEAIGPTEARRRLLLCPATATQPTPAAATPGVVTPRASQSTDGAQPRTTSRDRSA
jgi:transcriptional regulator with XRE-family HTH domain